MITINYNVWDDITYAFPNVNNTVVEIWEWISNFIPQSNLSIKEQNFSTYFIITQMVPQNLCVVQYVILAHCVCFKGHFFQTWNRSMDK